MVISIETKVSNAQSFHIPVMCYVVITPLPIKTNFRPNHGVMDWAVRNF